MNKMVNTNSAKAWILASRPKTLTGAAAPVLVGAVMSWNYMGEVRWLAFMLALGFAMLMQVAANFINDYYDWRKGTDRNEDRLGPERACAQGWITPKAMLTGIGVVVALACIIGLPLAFIGGWWLICIGVACVVFAAVYTLWFSYMGLGDLLVLVFFGIVPVGFTFYVMTDGAWTMPVTIIGVAQGLVTDMLLMVNNYRDRNQDRVSGKQTVVVRFGARFGLAGYLALGLVGVILALLVLPSPCKWIFMPLWLLLHLLTFRQMCRMDGRQLNMVLGTTARNIFLFAVAIILSVSILSC